MPCSVFKRLFVFILRRSVLCCPVTAAGSWSCLLQLFEVVSRQTVLFSVLISVIALCRRSLQVG